MAKCLMGKGRAGHCLLRLNVGRRGVFVANVDTSDALLGTNVTSVASSRGRSLGYGFKGYVGCLFMNRLMREGKTGCLLRT